MSEGRSGLDPDGAGDDWTRYGGAPPIPSRSPSEELVRDNPFAQYRYEDGGPPTEDMEHRSRVRSNLLGILVAMILIGAAAAVVNLAAQGAGPELSPAATLTPSLP